MKIKEAPSCFKKILPGVGKVQIKRQDLYRKPVRLKAMTYKLPGKNAKSVSIKARTLTPSMMRPLKVNNGLVKAMNRAGAAQVSGTKVAQRPTRQLPGGLSLDQSRTVGEMPENLRDKIFGSGNNHNNTVNSGGSNNSQYEVHENGRPDLSIVDINRLDGQEKATWKEGRQWWLKDVRKSSKGKWLGFEVVLKNSGHAKAYRIDVTAEHVGGREWPSREGQILSIMPGHYGKQIVDVFIPQTATPASNHKIRFRIDPLKVNNDPTSENNVSYGYLNLLPPIEPDLYIKKFYRRTLNRDMATFTSRAENKYDYVFKVSNKGQATSPATKINFKVQMVDNEGSGNPWLKLNRTYDIPSLAPSAGPPFLSAAI